MLASFETSFADALLNADRPVPRGITAHNTAIPARRFAVYRNNVVMGLGKALKSRFPVVEKIAALPRDGHDRPKTAVRIVEATIAG